MGLPDLLAKRACRESCACEPADRLAAKTKREPHRKSSVSKRFRRHSSLDSITMACRIILTGRPDGRKSLGAPQGNLEPDPGAELDNPRLLGCRGFSEIRVIQVQV